MQKYVYEGWLKQHAEKENSATHFKKNETVVFLANQVVRNPTKEVNRPKPTRSGKLLTRVTFPLQQIDVIE